MEGMYNELKMAMCVFTTADANTFAGRNDIDDRRDEARPLKHVKREKHLPFCKI